MIKILQRTMTAIGIAGLLAGCATTPNNRIPYQGEKPDTIYQIGLKHLKKGDYEAATSAFQALDAQYPFDHYTQKGDLGLIYAEFQRGNTALALATAERFIKTYPTNPQAAYAYYMTGLIDFNNGRGFLERRFRYRMSEHSTMSYQAAYKNFSTLIAQYPHSEYAADARRRMVFLDQVMAKHQLDIAEFYLHRDTYVAAANRAAKVLLAYPRTPEVQPALLVMLQAYHHLDLPVMTQTTANIIQLNYPNNKQYQLLIKAWGLKTTSPKIQPTPQK